MNIQEQNQIILQIGKNGISEELILSIKTNLAKNKLVKIKFLKNILETNSRKELSTIILEKLKNLKLEQKIVGNVLFLKRIKS